jgi:hypothetical protein
MVMSAALNLPLQRSSFGAAAFHSIGRAENALLITFSTDPVSWRYEHGNGDYTLMLSHIAGTIGWDPTPRDYSFLNEWDEPDA